MNSVEPVSYICFAKTFYAPNLALKVDAWSKKSRAPQPGLLPKYSVAEKGDNNLKSQFAIALVPIIVWPSIVISLFSCRCDAGQ